MTLEEAIKHCEEIVENRCDECGMEHRQLAEWLKELQVYKKEQNDEEVSRRWDESFRSSQMPWNHGYCEMGE